jgi:hypothetical protein
MKKRIFMGISVMFILIILIFTTPVKAADYAGHNFSEDYFAVEIDIWDDPANPDVIYDLVTGVEGTDSIPETDLQFYMNYMNESGIEVAYSALEKMEHWIKFRDLLPEEAVEVIEFLGIYNDELDAKIFHINATAPFQQLVQHFNTPWGTDAFVTNNFMTLVAYSNGTGSNAKLMDSEDSLYMGYTFAVQNITDVINDALEAASKSYRIPHFNYKASFEPTSTGYKFGINYTNMFVLWQKLDVELENPFGSLASYAPRKTGGIIYGQDIVAASVLDHLAFEYTFEVKEIELVESPTVNITVNLGTVETKYHIGETNFLITAADASGIPAGSFSTDPKTSPFITTPIYTLEIPDVLKGKTISGLTFPSDDIDIALPKMAFYMEDDAKIRMRMADGFGLTVVTSTNWCDVDITTEYATHLDKPERRININRGENVFFWTSFKDKMSYKLRELESLWGIDPNLDRDVYVKLFDPTGWSWVFPEVAKAYFLVEYGLALKFTQFIATKVAPEITYPGTDVALLANILYLTFTEFPEWFGGEIYHDPAYSAVAAVVAEGETDTSGEETTPGGVPGFELLSVLIAIPPMYALYRKRR